MRGENPFRCVQREIREVFMVHLVELISVNRSQQVRELDCDDSRGRQQNLETTDEVVQVRHLGENVIAEDQVRVMSTSDQIARGFYSEESHERGDALRFGYLGDVRRWLYPERGDSTLNEILKQITIVARDLDNTALARQAELVDHLIHVVTRVVKPGIRERGKISVVGEDLLAGDILLQLHQEAALTDPHVERIKGFHLIELIGTEKTFTQRRHPQIDDAMPEGRSTKTAASWYRSTGHCCRPDTRAFDHIDDGHPIISSMRVGRLGTGQRPDCIFRSTPSGEPSYRRFGKSRSSLMPGKFPDSRVVWSALRQLSASKGHRGHSWRPTFTVACRR